MNQKIDTRRTIIAVDSHSPFERGTQRSEALGEELPGGIALYGKLFRTVGVKEETVRADAERIIDAVADWSPTLVDEMRGVAAGAGVEPWQVAALNARTEILSQALGTRPGECSTIGRVADHVFGVQTWDWHEELDPHWHLQSVAGTKRSFVGLTEHGMLSKIGMNDAGVSVFLNILGHRDDHPSGVPIHLLTAEILANASSVEEGVDIVRSARVTTSSALTIMDEFRAVTVEISPDSVVVIQPEDGTLAHTNHFLDELLGAGEKPGLYDPDSQDRLALVHSRLRRYPVSTGVDDILPFLYSDPGQPGICCVPKPDATFGNRWATLATVTMENRKREMRVANGTPIDARTEEWMVMTPGR
ncbi:MULTISPECIES: C45 family peptidase [Arthrobacter]|uniref:Penicillin acyltransferase n=1 Tax=Arthrobacter terricola TaxID=2547396 RepID=A0A4R5KB40_9MICC|nr:MULTISPECIES: C45 family peptidase [Arthrobacter]MBT8162280.1 C45 family peptidase [Arthrobacter sp. GN70]TDF92246.1 penicillin acyltransferase [Arthrobacter terricola]